MKYNVTHVTLNSMLMTTETRKSEIINTAAKLFKHKGYSAVTMRDLAQAMGIKAASLYNHIESKQAILEFIIIAIAEEFTLGMQTILNSNLNTINKLEAIIKMHVSIANHNPEGMAALNNDWMHLEEKRDYYLELRQQYESNLRFIIAEGVAKNELKDLKTDVVLFSILSTLRSLYLWIPKKELLDVNELSSDLSEVLIGGINK